MIDGVHILLSSIIFGNFNQFGHSCLKRLAAKLRISALSNSFKMVDTSFDFSRHDRRFEQNSPKSSPRGGSRSPAITRQDTTGTLRTTITLGKNPSVVHCGPFYLLKEPPEESDLTGSTNLMSYYGLEHSYNKFSGKKVKEELSAFLPNLPGNIDAPGVHDNSSLRSLIEKPPITGKEILPLSSVQLSGFRLHPGPLPEQYRLMSQAPQKKKHKHKKHRHDDGPLQESMDNASESYERKPKKKRSEEEKRKKKKEKKRKKQKHSPDHPSHNDASSKPS